MSRGERLFVLWTLAYMVVYSAVFVSIAYRDVQPSLSWLLTFHFLGMAQNFAALFLTIRDLYKRPFPNPNQKLTWALLILCTGGIGWLVYIFKHAIKPRPSPT